MQLLFWSIDLCHLEISGSRKINGLNLREPKGLKNLIYTKKPVTLVKSIFNFVKIVIYRSREGPHRGIQFNKVKHFEISTKT